MGGITVIGESNKELSAAVETINKGMQDGTLAALGFNVNANVDFERFIERIRAERWAARIINFENRPNGSSF
jgi:hypothetical protein